MRRRLLLVLFCATGCAPRTSIPSDRSLLAPPPLGWTSLRPADRQRAQGLASAAAAFLGRAKTVRAAARALLAAARERGFVPLPEPGPVRAGERHFLLFRETSVAFFLAGKRPAAEGITLHVLSIDAPHLSLKPAPADVRHEFLLLQTEPAGPIDLERWLSVPLALHGFVRGERGLLKELVIGEVPGDPVLIIPDLSPHVARRAQAKRVVEPEQMDPIFAGPGRNRELFRLLEQFLAARDLGVRDFRDGEWNLVPAAPPRFVGFDRGLLAAYGQAYRTQALVALLALANGPTPNRTQVLIVTPESGSRASAGAGGFFVRHAVGRLLAAAGAPSDDFAARRVLARSRAILAGPNGGRLGGGMVLNQRFDDADPALVRTVLDAFRAGRVPYQIAETHGRLSPARWLTRLNLAAMEVTLPVSAIDRALQITSAFDLWAAWRAYRTLRRL